MDTVVDGSKVSYRLNEAGYRKVADMAASGHSQASIAAALGCSYSWMSEHKKTDEALMESYTRGKGVLEDNLVAELYRQAMDDHSTSAAIFLCKGVLGMREVGPTDPNAPNTAIQVNISVPAPLDASQVEAVLGRPIPVPHDD